MKILLLPLIVVIAIVIFDFVNTRRLIGVGVALSNAAQPFSRKGNGPRILVIGDSTAVGTGASTSSKSLAGLLGAHYPNATIENRGVNGARTADLIARFDQVTGTYDLIMLHIGGNDTVRFTKLDALKKAIASVLMEAKTKATHVVLVSTGNIGTARLLPFGTRWAYALRTRTVRSIFKSEAERQGVIYVDLFREPSVDPFAQDHKKYYAADSFHPSDVGYADWFSLIEKRLPL